VGHSTNAFTLDVYSHAIPHLQKEAARDVAAHILNSHTGNDIFHKWYREAASSAEPAYELA
jgi:hypothetical protein